MPLIRSRSFAASMTMLAAAIGIVTSGLAGRASGANSNWAAYAGDKASTKYSPLDQINRGNLKGLSIAWRRSALPEELRTAYPDAQAPANLQHTPLVVDGLLYMSSAVGVVVALEPTTGKTVWMDTLPKGADGKPGRGGSTRGLAYWSDGTDARIITNVGSNLVALNAKTGKRYADFGDNVHPDANGEKALADIIYNAVDPNTTGPVANGTYTLTPLNATGSRLDGTGWSISNGNDTQIWAASGNDNQRWVITNIGGSKYKIQPSYCMDETLDVTNGANNGLVQYWYDYQGSPNQSWTFTAVSGGYTITPACQTGSRLSVKGTGNANGTQVDIETSSGASKQTWALTPG